MVNVAASSQLPNFAIKMEDRGYDIQGTGRADSEIVQINVNDADSPQVVAVKTGQDGFVVVELPQGYRILGGGSAPTDNHYSGSGAPVGAILENVTVSFVPDLENQSKARFQIHAHRGFRNGTLNVRFSISYTKLL